MKNGKTKKPKQPENTVLAKATVDREEFLQKLQEVQPGLSKSEIVEQSSCFVFKDGKIITFNEQIACIAKSGLPAEAQGAVQHKKFIDMLRKFPDPTVALEFSKKQVVIRGKNKDSEHAIEHKILIPIEVVKVPDKWKKISDDFTDAIGIVQECATKDETAFTLTCIHIHPQWMEAFDNTQMARYTLKTGVAKPFLVSRDSIKFLPAYDLTHIAETDKWLHFKTATGTVISIERYLAEAGDYQNLTEILGIKGMPIVFPKALDKAADRANVHSADNTDKNLVTIELKPGKLRIIGLGDQGKYRQQMNVKYSGKPTKFQIAPNLLCEILKRDTECTISKTFKLKVDGGKFVYIACLEEC